MLLPFLAEERQHLDAVCNHLDGQGCSRFAVWLNADSAYDGKFGERLLLSVWRRHSFRTATKPLKWNRMAC